MAHELRDAALARQPLEQRKQRIDADLALVLELAREVIRCAHAARAESVALLVGMDPRRRSGLARELADGPFERGMVVHPVMRVEVRGRTPEELASAPILRAVLEQGFFAVDLAGHELCRPKELPV